VTTSRIKNSTEHSAGHTTTQFTHPTFSAHDQFFVSLQYLLDSTSESISRGGYHELMSANYGHHRSLSSLRFDRRESWRAGIFPLCATPHDGGERDVFCRYFLLHSSNTCSYFGVGIRALVGFVVPCHDRIMLRLSVWSWVAHWVFANQQVMTRRAWVNKAAYQGTYGIRCTDNRCN
jgi:hypothetical protein